jgi:hypothetical protein
MALVTFFVTRDAGDSNYLVLNGPGGPYFIGPSTGNFNLDLSPGTTYTLSAQGSGPGSVAIGLYGTCIGLDDRQGAGGDGDFNDLTICPNRGIFTTSTFFVPYDPVTISSFTANPNPQNSTDGIPQYSTRLSWNTQNGTSVSITSSAGETFSNLPSGGFLDITNLPQSIVGSNSPSIRSYTLFVSNPEYSQQSQPLEVQARNDNTPSNSWTQSFSNLNPSTEYEFFIGKLTGVDMPTNISTSGDGNFVGKTIGGQFDSSALFNDQDNVILKFTSLPFNTDISGETGIYGKSNSKTIPVTAGTQSFNVTVTTRAPRIAEDFNYFDNKDQYPYEDIDLITNNPIQYLNTAIVTADDIDIPVEIKTDNPDIQVRINNGTWTNIRQI